MAILYTAADSIELETFAQRLTGLRKLKWPIDYAYEGVLEGRRVMLAANGAGPKLAAQAVEIAIRAVTAAELSSSKLESVVSTGFCGGLDPALRECRIVVASEVIDLATQESFMCVPVVSANADFASAVIGSQDRIALDAAEKQRLATLGAGAVDMESAGVAARARRAGLPFCCIKVVSDRADESFSMDLNKMRTTEGRIARGKIVFNALTHPKRFPDLLRLKRRANQAAQALAEFLVGCRISSGGEIPSSA